MTKQLHYTQEIEKDLPELLLALENEKYPLVIRGAHNEVRNRNYWGKLLSEKCGLTLDYRQYDFDENLQQAKWWEISNQPDKESSYAHSTTPQPFHNDNAWFGDAAEVNFFIMKKQVAEGGEQLIYPVSRLIQDLEVADQTLLNDLLNTEVTISKGADDNQNVTKIITNDETGYKTHWNYYRTIKTDTFVNELCERFFSFLQEQRESNSVFKLRAESGDAFAFNDQRLLHARTSFKAEKPKDRILLQSMWRIS